MLIRTCLPIAVSAAIISASPTPSHNANAQHAPPPKRDMPGYRNVAYFVNWAIYGRNFHPQNLTASTLTHVLYAFANIRPDTGEVYLTDTYADLEKHYPTDSWTTPSTSSSPNLYGALKQLYLLKQTHRNLKILLSIGGWTYSSNFPPATASPVSRARFAQSAVALVRDLGFDGLDLDWEYPANVAEAGNYVSLLREVRAGLDELGREGGGRYLLSVACPAGERNYGVLDLRGMDRYLDFWNLMAYDFAGSFSPLSAHASNLHPSPYIPLATPFSASRAITAYLSAGVPARKLVLGIPLYGRAFAGTTRLGGKFVPAVEGSWESGVWDHKALPGPHSIPIYDPIAGASYAYDPQAQVIVSYDSVASVERKVRYVRDMGLGGVMWWEASGDRVGEGSLIESAWKGLGGAEGTGMEMERRENWLEYNKSRFGNLRGGMVGG